MRVYTREYVVVMRQAVIFAGTWTQKCRSLSIQARMISCIVPCVCILIAIGAAIVCWPRETMLFATSLDSEQLAQIDAQLAAWNIAHVSISDNVMVDQKMRDTILLRLSLAGLPRAHIADSNETLAKASALTPDALLEMQSRTGLAGDIAMALRDIDGIADARVVIAPARQGTFVDEASSQASASVRLSLRPGVVLSKDAVDGIRGFISSAVPNLDRARVVLLDDRGVALGKDGAGGDDAEATRVALQSAFDAAIGTGATLVRVHASYAQRAEHMREIDHLPVVGGTIAVQRSDEQYRSREKQYAKHDSTENRGSIERERDSSALVGALDRLSVAVLVDDTRELNLEKIRNTAFAVTGMDAARGDSVRVEAVRFAHPGTFTLPREIPWLTLFSVTFPYFGAFAILVFVMRVLPGPLQHIARRMLERKTMQAATQAGKHIPPREVLGLLAGEPAHTAAAVISALPTVTAAAVLDLYPSDERGAIVARMARQAGAFAPTWEELARVR
jgi:flagellar biosynthesis/type III secretory pathway M-ring protein FliF/YscJ